MTTPMLSALVMPLLLSTDSGGAHLEGEVATDLASDVGLRHHLR